MNPKNASNFLEDCQTSVYTPTTVPHNTNQKCYDNSSRFFENSTESEFIGSSLGKTFELVVWCFVYSVTSFVIVIGNALTIIIFRTNVKFRRRKEHCFLFSLAVADMFVGIADVPLQIFLLIQSWPRGDVGRYLILNIAFLTSDVFFGLASTFTLTAIALERLYSVMKPQKHRKVKKRTYWYLVRVPWGVSALQSFFYLLSLNNVLPFDVVFQFIVISLLCAMMFICASYVTIWMMMTKRKQNNSSQTSNLTDSKSHFQVKNERKLTILVVIVTGVFALTWLPFQIINVIFYVCYLNSCKPNISTTWIRFIKALQYSNSLINPFIYSYNIKGFRKYLRKKLTDLFHLSCLHLWFAQEK